MSRKSWHSLRGDWSFSEVRPTAPSQDSGPAPRWHCPPIPSPAARWDSAPLFHWIVVRRQSSAVNLCGASPSGRKPVSSRQSIDTQRHPLSPKGRGLFPPPQFLFLYKWKKRRVLSPLASQNAVPLATRSGRFQSRDRRKGQYHLETRHGSPRTAGAQPDETLRPEEPLLSPLSSGRTAEGVEWFVRI